ncbi:hypothetical protein [Nocardioides ungokensis]|uniref:hypothetical protein n=1 Tax=Nocardioides ungokensis TaxID=1643322 RepID=UPI0015DE9097|nr:hypothetical protein [Nocardioides ungokensis]
MDIGTEIDRSFGDGPAPGPVDDLLAAGSAVPATPSARHRDRGTGRGRHRRRRSLVEHRVRPVRHGLLTGRGHRPDAHPERQCQCQCHADPRPTRQALRGGELVALTLDGRLAVRDGVDILKRVPNPMGSTEPATSLGLEISYRGKTYWYLLDSDGTQSTGSSHDEARVSFPTLKSWLDDQVALQSGGDTLALVHFAGPGTATLQPLDGVTVVQQRAGVDLGPDFAGPDATTAVAEVRWQGETWFVLARRLPGSPPEYFPTAASVSAPTLAGFLDYARGRYAGGAGLR